MLVSLALLILFASAPRAAPPFPVPAGLTVLESAPGVWRTEPAGSLSDAARAFATALRASGWLVLFESRDGMMIAQKSRPWGETRLELRPDGDGLRAATIEREIAEEDLNPHQMGEIAPLAARLAAAMDLNDPSLPAGQPAAHEDFPFLHHLPGLELQPAQEERLAGPLLVNRPTPGGWEEVGIAGPVVVKHYHAPSPFRTLQLYFAYYRAMPAAGWTLIESHPGDFTGRPHLVMTRTISGEEVWVRLEFWRRDVKILAARGRAEPVR